MAWTTPTTVVTNDLMTASYWNTYVRDNLLALKSPPTASYEVNEASNYTITATSFANVDSTDLSLSITTTGGDVLIGWNCTLNNNGASTINAFDVTMDGTRIGGDDGIHALFVSNGTIPISFTYLKRSVSAGAHTFNLQCKVSAGTATIYAGAGTSNLDLHPQFWVREV